MKWRMPMRDVAPGVNVPPLVVGTLAVSVCLSVCLRVGGHTRLFMSAVRALRVWHECRVDV
jgi:hypothetical protein